jgi:hypothetical protein
MADNILKLKVESSEYDAKLKKAAEGIRHLAEVAHQGGGELTGLEKSELDYVKALGEMDTKSRTAAGSVRELESSYKELKVIYDQLNEVEKADEGGKALASSLEQIKQRAQEAKAQLESASQSLSDNGQQAQQSSGILDALASKFTLNIDALKLFDMGLSAVNMALDVAKDAFFNNEEQLDEWGRVVESSQSLYEGFLNALNTGDISGFLSNIGRIEQAARDAYDALDALGTYNAFNQINIERTRTDMTESIADFRGGKGTKEGVKAAGDAYKKELADRQRLENDAYIAAVKEMAAKRGANAKDLMDALSGTYGHYQDLKSVQPSGTRTRYIPGLPGQAGRYEEYKVAQNNQERLGEALRHLNDTELQSLQALGAQAQRTGTEIAQVDKQLTRVLNGKQPGETTKSGKSSKTVQTELQQNQAKINTLTQEYVKLGEESTEVSRQRQVEIQMEIQLLKERNGLLGLRAEQAQGRLTLKTSDFAFGGASGDGLLANPFASDDKSMNIKGSLGLQLDPSVLASAQKDADSYIDQLVKGAKQTEKAWGMAGQAVQGIGSAFAMIDDPAAKVAGTVMQAIASVALGFAMASKSADTVASGWGWLAWLGAGATAMATTIATIHSLTGYASGGVIKGNSYSGDNIIGMVDGGGLVGLNAGEIVLNKAQTANVANELTNNQPRAMRVNGRISGHDIVLAADRSLAQEGKGHIVTWK